MVSELVTNAVVHAEGDIQVRLLLSKQVLRVEVSDSSTSHPSPADPPRIFDESGRGIHVVASVARSWGSDPRSTPGGKTVWFELQRPNGT